MPSSAPRRRTWLQRAAGAALATCGLAAVAAPPAHAADQVTPNACFYGIDGFWRSLDLRLGGTAAPQYVLPGDGFRLAGTAASATLPGWVAEYGFNLGLLNAGDNQIPAKVWVAIAGGGSTRGTEVVQADTVAQTTITADATGQRFASATPMTVTVPLPDTTWGAPTGGTDRVSFAQAGPGTLPAVPAEAGAAAATPRGSIFIRARLTNSTVFDLDCQPGSGGPTGETFSTGGASPFEVAWLDPEAAPTGIAPPAAPTAEASIATTKLRATRAQSRLSLRLRNGAGSPATGQVRIRTAARHRVGKVRRVVTAVSWTQYTVPAAGARTLSLKLGSGIRAVLRKKDTVSVSVSLRPVTGTTPGPARSTRMTLHAR